MKYDLIFCDCPWTYNNQKNNDPSMGGITYPVMTQDELKNLPIKEVTNKDSICLMWATMPKLQEALDLMKAWSFEYKTCVFNWIKINPTATVDYISVKGKKQPNVFINGGIYSGLGSYCNGNAELVLLGKRGKGLTRFDKSVKQIQIHPRGKHSEKPSLHSEIERLFGNDIKRAELFARKPVEGWDCYGNDIDGEDIRSVLDKICKALTYQITPKINKTLT